MDRLIAWLVAAIATALLLGTAVATAQPPEEPPGEGAPIRFNESQEVPAGAVYGDCAFPFLFEQNGKTKTIELPNGDSLTTSPGLKATLTNLDEPTNRVTLNITGALRDTTLENGDVVTVATGRNLLGDPEAGLVLARGRFTFVISGTGDVVQPLRGEGKLTDVCALLE